MKNLCYWNIWENCYTLVTILDSLWSIQCQCQSVKLLRIIFVPDFIEYLGDFPLFGHAYKTTVQVTIKLGRFISVFCQCCSSNKDIQLTFYKPQYRKLVLSESVSRKSVGSYSTYGLRVRDTVHTCTRTHAQSYTHSHALTHTYILK